MKPFPVYSLFDLTPVRAEGSRLYDTDGAEYLDLYGGHAVISIGHSHTHFVRRITEQLGRMAFYSNSVQMPLQVELAEKVGVLSGYPDYALFMVNSGAEANENALKLASFHTGRTRVLTFTGGWHGRTSAAVAVTDDAPIIAPLNAQHSVLTVQLNDLDTLRAAFEREGDSLAAAIVEGIQGVAGVVEPSAEFLQELSRLCREYGVVLILDEVQSGAGRTGKFFAHQWAGIRPDVITMAKGMGNGFPVGALMIAPSIEPRIGMLGTTFGGAHLACAAALAVVEVTEREGLVAHAAALGERWIAQLRQVPGVVEVRGRGLMIGVQLEQPSAPLRTRLLQEHRILVGSAGQKQSFRLLPSLALAQEDADRFTEVLAKELSLVHA
jgi:acetylornithine aminotransferase